MTTLSDLPEDLVYNILSYMGLTSKGVIELSLVSKQFLSILEKHPALHFSSWSSHPEMQLKYTISTLERYHKHNIPLNKFRFYLQRKHSCSGFYLRTQPACVCSFTDTYVYDRCIRMAAAQKGLRFLSLFMPEDYEFDQNGEAKLYSVPQPVLEVDSLLKLALYFCSMQLLPKRVAWRNLRELSLHAVDIGEGVFLNTMKSCPLIERLDIFMCSGDIQYEYLSPTKLGTPMLYQNLKELSLQFGFGPGLLRATTSAAILDFPRLEELRISNTCSNTTNISSPSLKRIDYEFRDNREGQHQAHFDAPNMVDFNFNWHLSHYYGNGLREIDFPKLSFAGNSSGWISRIVLTVFTEVRSRWLLELERLLKIVSAALNSSEIASVTFVLKGETIANADEMTVPRERIPGIPDVYIESRVRRLCLSSARAILDGIVCICQPKRVIFNQFKTEYETETPPLFEHRVKFPWPDLDECMEVLKNHDKEDSFSLVFNLEYEQHLLAN